MKIKNIDGMSAADLQQAVNEGGKFVYFAYTISLIVVTFRDTSGVYLVRAGESAVNKSILFTISTLLFGWWGIPWGPKYTIEALSTNLRGGKNVTDEVMSVVAGFVLFEEANQQKRG